MKKKGLIIAIIVLLVAAGIGLTIWLLNRNTSINYTKLDEDKISIQNSGSVVNAKRVTNNQYSAEVKYEGEGYYIMEYIGGEIVVYKIYDNNDKEIWSYDKLYPMTPLTD